MKEIQILDKCFVPYLKEEEILKAIDAVADRMNSDFKGCDDVPVLLCVLNGAVMFTAELMKRLDFPFEFASLKIRSYEGTHSTGTVNLVNGFNGDVKGRRVIICEDIVDTGASMEFLLDYLEHAGATDIKVCTMLLKPDVFRKNFKIDYVAKSIPNDFILGFGLDYNELGRGLKDIYVIKQ